MDLYQLLAVIGSLLSAEFVLGVWLSNQFGKVTIAFERLRKELLDKLEYHERHDDKRFDRVDNRFTQLHESLWEMKVSNLNEKLKVKE